LDQSESFHSWAVEQLKSIQVPLITCEAVIAEACFLLRSYPAALANIGTWIERGIIERRFVLAREAEATSLSLRNFPTFRCHLLMRAWCA
jgi:uncharacterized protein